MIRDAARKLAHRLVLWDAGRRLWQRRQLRAWDRKGRPAPPPPRFKQHLVAAYAKRFAREVLVETGTFLGDMLFAVRDSFRTIYSIELDPWLYRRARRRFGRYRHIHLVPGNSSEMLPFVLSRIDRPALFWLDAHQMAGGVRGFQVTPVARELEQILLDDRDDVILIDDARLFTGIGYPTIDQVRERILAQRPGCAFEVEDDVIRAHPPV